MADKAASKADAPAPVKTRGKRLVLFGSLVFLLLAGGGAGAYWYTRPAPQGEAAEKAKEETHEPEISGVVPFDPIVVNLADGAGARFLRVTVQLVIPGEGVAAEVEEDAVRKARLRSKLLELFSEQKSERLVTPEGKTALKAAIIEHASEVLAPHKVSDVLFTDFIVQF